MLLLSLGNIYTRNLNLFQKWFHGYGLSLRTLGFFCLEPLHRIIVPGGRKLWNWLKFIIINISQGKNGDLSMMKGFYVHCWRKKSNQIRIMSENIAKILGVVLASLLGRKGKSPVQLTGLLSSCSFFLRTVRYFKASQHVLWMQPCFQVQSPIPFP